MDYTVEFEPEAIVSLERFSSVVRERILRKIRWLAENFDQINPQPLTGNLVGFFKLRVGDYRVIYDFSIETKIITIDQIGHRSEIYG
ncbi:MAG: type II toxin-antitoxin system RelE/ParE family toxin [Symploca sp. SIO2E6]|nr:type II toxin-antitoxin system RelE/ParE family toxin [Symploca sp. SIO2E6]